MPHFLTARQMRQTMTTNLMILESRKSRASFTFEK
jgi:hypothetical protein